MRRVTSARIVLFFLFLLVLDISVLPAFRIGAVQPYFLYLAVLFIGFTWGAGSVLHAALLAGVMMDLTGSRVLGASTLTLAALAIPLDFVLQKMDRDSWLVRLLVGFLFVYSALVLQLIFVSLLRLDWLLNFKAISFAFQTALYTAAVMPLFFLMSSKWLSRRRLWRGRRVFDQ